MVGWYRGLGEVRYNPAIHLSPNELSGEAMQPAAQLAYLQTPFQPAAWGNLRYVAGQAYIAVQLAKLFSNSSEANSNAWRREGPVCFALQQVQLMVGGSGKSFVVGVGPSPPCRVHHRGASCPVDHKLPCDCTALWNPGCNPTPLVGALVGGPGDSTSHNDSRMNFRQNEPALDYNAAFTGMEGGEACMIWARRNVGGTRYF
jgi:hypothetical protein